ncbi:hypothetical protein D3H35_26045 [Cohnella faecalis]|uniref:DeoR-like transcriptional repressor C-terminal sensor domain-containing protein n=2 Tax=Cohnella faecalis TaxID=2315694 RepID=A0A398CG12_9BACL|nr:hypothetical protein D3H35_26045 [Cohnella faecalis]
MAALRPFQHERLLSSFIWINARWRWMKNAESKAAADLVENGDSIILDSGSTTIEIAKQLVNHTKLTIITNDLYIASTVAFHPSTQVMVTGGMKRKT